LREDRSSLMIEELLNASNPREAFTILRARSSRFSEVYIHSTPDIGRDDARLAEALFSGSQLDTWMKVLLTSLWCVCCSRGKTIGTVLQPFVESRSLAPDAVLDVTTFSGAPIGTGLGEVVAAKMNIAQTELTLWFEVSTSREARAFEQMLLSTPQCEDYSRVVWHASACFRSDEWTVRVKSLTAEEDAYGGGGAFL
jgi:hypothetical protein